MAGKLSVYTDGGARGNPGPSAVGVFAVDEKGEKVFLFGKRIEDGTNNTAEYKAVIEALEHISKDKNILAGFSGADFYMDSELICLQLRGKYKVKNENLKSLLHTVRKLEERIMFPISYNHIPRDENKNADRLVNLALDNKI